MRQLPVLAVVGSAVYLAVLPRGGIFGVVALELALVVLWYLFLNNTACAFEGREGPCRNDAYGKIRGCRRFVSHRQGKRAAVLEALNLANPENAFRVTWRDDRAAVRTVGGRARGPTTDAQRPENRSQARFNVLSLIVAVIGSTAGVLALFIDPGA